MASSRADGSADPVAALDELAACRAPFLIGVRHHSPVVARAIPAMLDAAAPDELLIELPMEFAGWIEWIGHPESVAPMALGGVAEDGSLAFYPFADFSPELAAIRWARTRGVPVAPCDLPLASRVSRSGGAVAGSPDDGPGLVDLLRARLSGRDDDDLWDRLVEAGAAGSDAEQVRRAALAVGWALRGDTPAVDPYDLAREAWMRSRIAAASGRVAVVVGAFHAPALLGGPDPDPAAHDLATAPGPAALDSTASGRPAPDAASARVVTSLVPYPFPLLDSRSGYPAGIRDPRWQQALVECDGTPAAVVSVATSFAVRVAVALRAAGHPAGPAEAAEVSRVAADLARLRGLPAPGRGELVEALQTVLAHGDVHGRGRAVAAAMREVLVGSGSGRLAPGTPRSGLVPAVLDMLADLRLPGPDDKRRDARGRPDPRVRLDPLRSPLDRRREIALVRLSACHVRYAERVESVGAGGTDTLTSTWDVTWQPATEPTIAVAGLHGVTLEQATEGVLRAARRAEVDAGGPTAAEAIAGVEVAAAAGLPGLLDTRLADVEHVVGPAGTLPDIIAALGVLEALARGHVPGTPEPPERVAAIIAELDAAAVRELAGLAGSDRIEDARALAAVAHRADAAGRTLRLYDTLAHLAADGTALMQGAAGAVTVASGAVDPDDFGRRVASWIDLGGDELRPRLSGLLVVAGSLMTAAEPLLAPVVARVEALTDADFTRRLPSLRGGFDVLSPAARERLRADLEHRVGRVAEVADPEALAAWLTHDQAGREAVEATRDAATLLPPAARWRLILGRKSDDLPPAASRQATALDQLYGDGHGEGSRSIAPPGAGRETPRPGARQWADELTDIFGAEVCQEVLGEAARRGDRDAALALDPETVRPSVELLHTVLSLAGGLPESQLARLRPLVAKVVADLTARLATKLRPALAGISTPRPTRRDTGRLDLRATIAANLRSVTLGPDGRAVIVPERPRFVSRARRSVDWRLVLVVDVSGSMEASTVWAALTSAVLAGIPAVTTHFITVSTEVIDLTDHADDPLGLLLEVSVGGGTHLALGLRHARSLVTVPQRTMVVMVSDFEEGWPIEGLLGEVRALTESGCRLLGCASLDDNARPRYAVGVAEQLVAAGMPVAALSPLALARWVAEQVR